MPSLGRTLNPTRTSSISPGACLVPSTALNWRFLGEVRRSADRFLIFRGRNTIRDPAGYKRHIRVDPAAANVARPGLPERPSVAKPIHLGGLRNRNPIRTGSHAGRRKTRTADEPRPGLSRRGVSRENSPVRFGMCALGRRNPCCPREARKANNHRRLDDRSDRACAWRGYCDTQCGGFRRLRDRGHKPMAARLRDRRR